jgi:hypothetical protein
MREQFVYICAEVSMCISEIELKTVRFVAVGCRIFSPPWAAVIIKEWDLTSERQALAETMPQMGP